jgi:transcriptional regulator with GAF, ATPase, and Fis domain
VPDPGQTSIAPRLLIRGRPRALITGALTLLFAAVAYDIQIQVATATGHTKTAEIIGGVTAAVLAVFIPSREQWLQVRERRVAVDLASAAKTDLRVAIADVLEPLTALLGQINKQTGVHKQHSVGLATQALLNSASGLAGSTRARACFFRLQQGPPKRLNPELWAGRSGKPHSNFLGGTAEGDAALAMCMSQERRYCEDVKANPPPGWSGTTSGYRTFVSVPVYAGNECFGMLTVDALNPGELAAETESGLVDVLAHLLGAILSA